MLTDPVLAVLALLFLWLPVRLRDSRTADGPDETARREVRVRKGVKAIGRVCRHLSQALQTTGATSAMDNLVRSIVESGPTPTTTDPARAPTGTARTTPGCGLPS